MKKLLTKKIQLLKPLQPIFLLSHMRSYSSVLGHIIGNNPEINGYYEMHLNYDNCKSFLRQKSRYLENHEFKKESKFLFDKILHNEHEINFDLISRKKSKIIITIREPEETILSIVSYYAQHNNTHNYSKIVHAAEYYKEKIDPIFPIKIFINYRKDNYKI